MTRHLEVHAGSLQPGDTIIDPDAERETVVREVRRDGCYPDRVTVVTGHGSRPVHVQESFLLVDESAGLREQIVSLERERDRALGHVEDLLAEQGAEVAF